MINLSTPGTTAYDQLPRVWGIITGSNTNPDQLPPKFKDYLHPPQPSFINYTPFSTVLFNNGPVGNLIKTTDPPHNTTAATYFFNLA